MPDRTAAEIEREIAEDRAALEQTIDELMDRARPDALVDRATAFLAESGQPVAQLLAEKVRENPAAAALAGVGLAWLLLGPRPSPAVDYDRRYGPPPAARPDVIGFDARLRAADRAMQREISNDISLEMERTMTQAKQTTPSQADDAMDTDHDAPAGNWTTVKARARIARARAYRQASELRERIDEGTAEMSAEARTRVRKARAAAIAAQERAEAMVSAAASEARHTARENPLFVGAAIFAAGAALGAALPRTETEDRTFGAYRDQLFDEAERVFREEQAKLKEVARAAVAESQDVLKEKLAEGRAALEDASARIAARTEEEAEKRQVGKA